jgi:hypothetical protein
MKSASSTRGIATGAGRCAEKIVLFVLLLMTVVSGCASLISNSENFYRDAPRRPINWREYLTD